MSLATLYSRAQSGLDAPLVSVEVHLANGLPSFSIVGLPEAAVRESKDRVRAAIINSNFEFPTRRITVNLAPADLPKDGGRFDLPIALGLLAASAQLPLTALVGCEFIGELSLSGSLRKTVGVLPAACACHRSGTTLITSAENEPELYPVQHADIFCATHLLDVCAYLNKLQTLARIRVDTQLDNQPKYPKLDEVIGQQRAKRALCIAATGQHHMLMIGSPGSGKTMLANRLPGLLVPMQQEEILETCSIYSIANVRDKQANLSMRPFRCPHHTVSAVGLAGGGSNPKPGEISLAHNGVLFLDELTEFDRRALEILREPLETGKITISRAAAQVNFPARFQLIAAMNPCPRGCDIDQFGQCACSSTQLRNYRQRISAPLLDRIDLQVNVPKLPSKCLLEHSSRPTENWSQINTQISNAYNLQLNRQGVPNARLQGTLLQNQCRLNQSVKKLALDIFERLDISARAFHSVIKVARTIADLESNAEIEPKHISEAISYRQFDRALNSA